MSYRCGVCSNCGVALESPDGGPDREKAVPRSRAVKRSGHCKRVEWRVIPDEPAGEYRYWHDHVPWFAR